MNDPGRNVALTDLAQGEALWQGVGSAVEQCLRQAAAAYRDDTAAERFLAQAATLAPDHVAVLIAQYRYYFYKGRLRESLEIAARCMTAAAAHLGMDGDWQKVQPNDADFGRYDAIWPRLYLFSLKAYGYLLARLGSCDESALAIAKLRELDRGDTVGGSVLSGVLDRRGLDDDG